MGILYFSLFSVSIALPIFGVGFYFAKRWSFYSLVDVLWPFSFALAAIAAVYTSWGVSTEFMVLAILFSLWGTRLGTHILTRLLRHYPNEDRRYVELKASNKANLNKYFLGFFAFQCLSIGLLIVPLGVAAEASSGIPYKMFWAGVITWFFGLFGEWISDEQLKRFIFKPENQGKVCDRGFWKYSRHPNYFFEWVMWLSYAIAVIGLDNWAWAWVSPAVMLLLLTKVTGIPYAEKMSLQSKGDLYREYQRTTSSFIPWFKKQN